jgi:hypothetical protein
MVYLLSISPKFPLSWDFIEPLAKSFDRNGLNALGNAGPVRLKRWVRGEARPRRSDQRALRSAAWRLRGPSTSALSLRRMAGFNVQA